MRSRTRPQRDQSLGARRGAGYAPFDGVSATSRNFGRRIQAEIKTLVDSGTMTGSKKNDRRRLRYGDMLVTPAARRCVRRRDPGTEARQYPGRQHPRLGKERIAVIDLMNLADALLLPQDDLALAVALKSPLFGLTDDDLFKVAPGSARDRCAKLCRTPRPMAGWDIVAARTMRAPFCPRNAVCVYSGCSAATVAARGSTAAARARGQRRAQ